MQRVPDHEYKGYTITINVWPATGNRYQADFTVLYPEGNLLQLPQGTAIPYTLKHRESREQGANCGTADEAHQDAIDRAYAYIDANPLKTT